jgi:hypothetical protein
METRIQIVSIVVMLGIFGIVLELVRQKRLMERYALLWLFSATVLLALAVWEDGLEEFARAVGIVYAPSALFAAALGFVLMLLMHFSLVISRHADQNKVLAQRLALLQRRVDELERSASGPLRGSGEAIERGEREVAVPWARR